jgi:hypothetical protein
MMADKKSDKPMSEKMMSEHSKAMSSPVMQALAAVEDRRAEMCCCCICECSTEHTRELGCCCFFPIRCGVIAIGVFILILTLV